MRRLWMKVMIETSVLVAGSVFWEYDDKERERKFPFKHRKFFPCDRLFRFLKSNVEHEIGIITKTVEDEAKNVLDRAVINTLKGYFEISVPNFVERFGMMTFQDIVTTESLDRLDRIVEECSIRPPIDIAEREKIKKDKLQPFFESIVPTTFRFKQPHMPSFIRGESERMELGELMLESLPIHGTVYKGMPEDRDLMIMAEATFLARKYKEEKIFVTSLDNHFKPNPVQIYSYTSPTRRFSGEVDSTVRDELEKNFGFRGDYPTEIYKELEREYGKID